MSDIAITAANVVADTTASRESGTAGETIAAGKFVYKNSTSHKWMLADADSVTAAARQARGVALNSASLDQPLVVATGGPVTIGGTLTAGLAYYLSSTAGGMCPVADIGTGEYVCLLGIAASTTVLNVGIQFPNVVL